MVEVNVIILRLEELVSVKASIVAHFGKAMFFFKTRPRINRGQRHKRLGFLFSKLVIKEWVTGLFFSPKGQK